jgi:hypothetical protein
MIKWDFFARPEEKEGLGIKDIDKMNKSRLVKWW